MPSGVRRKKHNRSSIAKATRRVKDKHGKVPIAANPIIAAHWDPKLTLVQNFEKFGLKAKLGRRAGGVEKKITLDTPEPEKEDDGVVGPNEGRIVRHDDGTVTVEYSSKTEESDDDTLESEPAKTTVVEQLEAYARTGVTKPRVQSEREKDWIQRLVEKHGDNFEAMFRDRRLNIYQQSVGDLRRRVYKWNKSQGKA